MIDLNFIFLHLLLDIMDFIITDHHPFILNLHTRLSNLCLGYDQIDRSFFWTIDLLLGIGFICLMMMGLIVYLIKMFILF